MRAVGYIRLNLGNALALGGEEQAFATYCFRNDHDLVEVYRDVSEDRSGYEQMIGYLKGADGKAIAIVSDSTHLGSDLESVVKTLLEIESVNSRAYCVNSEFPDPIQNALQTLGVKGVSRTRSKHIRDSMSAQALQGKGLGRPLFGYSIGSDGSMQTVRQEAVVVELVFKLYTKDKLGFRLIAQHLNERDIRTRRGGNWNVVSIRDMLRNPGYMGTYSRFGIVVPRVYPPIVPTETFRTAQEIVSARRPVGRVSKIEPFLLSGLAYCGACGNKMMGVTRRQRWKTKDGKRNHGIYRYYQCQSRQNQSRCEYHTWRETRLEAAVLSQLRLLLKTFDRQPQDVTDNVSHERSKTLDATRKKRLVNAERRFTDAVKRAAKAAIGLDIVSEYLEELEKARRAVSTPSIMGDATKMLDQWDSLNYEERRNILMENIERVTVGDDTVELTF